MRLLSQIANAVRKGGGGSEPPEEVVTNKTLLVSGGIQVTTTAVSASTTYYGFIGCAQALSGWGTTEANRRVLFPRAGTLRNVRLYVATNTRTTDSYIRVRANGENTGLAVFVPPGVTGWFETDEIMEYPVAEGDLICWAMTTGTGSGYLLATHLQVEFEGSAAATMLYVKGGSNLTANHTESTSYYSNIVGEPRAILWGWESNINWLNQTIMGCSGKFTHAQVLIGTNTYDAAVPLRLFKNGVDTGVYLTIGAGVTGRVSANIDVDVAPDDYFHWMLDKTGLTLSSGVLMGLHLVALTFESSDGTWDLLGQDKEDGNGGGDGVVDQYLTPGGTGNINTEEPLRQVSFPWPAELSRLRVRGWYNQGSGADPTPVVVRVNQADTAMTLTLPISSVYKDDLSDPGNTVDLEPGDRVSIALKAPGDGSPHSWGLTVRSFEPAPVVERQGLPTPLWSYGPNLAGGAAVTWNSTAGARYARLGGYYVHYIDYAVALYASEGGWRSQAAADGAISALGVNITQNNRGEATVLTLMVNGVASTTQVITVPAGATGWVSASGEPQAVIKGDLLSVRVSSATADGTTIGFDALEAAFTADEDVSVVHHFLNGDYMLGDAPSTTALGAPISGISNGNTFVSGWSSFAGYTDPAPWAAPVQTACTFSDMQVEVPFNTSSEDVTVTLYKSGVATALSVTIPAAQTGLFGDTAHAVEVAPGDYLEYRKVAAANGTGSVRIGSIQAAATSASNYDILAPSRAGSTLQDYGSVPHWAGPGFHYLEKVADNGPYTNQRFPFACAVTKLFAHARFSNVGPGSWPLALMKNGGETGLSVEFQPVTAQTVVASGEVGYGAGSRVNLRFQSRHFSQAIYSYGLTISKPPAELVGSLSTFLFSGAPAKRSVPAGVAQVRAHTWGAGGTSRYFDGSCGAYAGGYIDVEAGDILEVQVGEGGKAAGALGYGPAAYPDGGRGRIATVYSTTPVSGQGGGGGGGSSRVYKNGVLMLVAGAAGGSQKSTGGVGGGRGGGFSGGFGGGVGTGSPAGSGGNGGGYAVEGSSLLQGGDGDVSGGNGGGGGGYYGGGGATSNTSTGSSGGGGSSYAHADVGDATDGTGSGATPPNTSFSAYPGRNVGIGGAGNNNNIPHGPGGGGAVVLLSYPTRTLSAGRLYQQHVEIVSAGTGEARFYQQHVEIVRSVT